MSVFSLHVAGDVLLGDELGEGQAVGRSVFAEGEQAQDPGPAAHGCAGLLPAAPSISRARTQPGMQPCCFHCAWG